MGVGWASDGRRMGVGWASVVSGNDSGADSGSGGGRGHGGGPGLHATHATHCREAGTRNAKEEHNR